MMSIGEKIKNLRIALGLSQHELAVELEISLKSIYRYESDNSRPESYVLAKLAVYFDVSADYLLGISAYNEQLEEVRNKLLPDGGLNPLYIHYRKCKEEYALDENAIYYWIEADDDRIGGQTQWVGWTDESRDIEIRELRPVIPQKAIEFCSKIYGKPMVLNSREDASTFIIFGGAAIVRKDICEKYLPWFLKYYSSNSEE